MGGDENVVGLQTRRQLVEAIERARLSLEGLSVGDSFGELFKMPGYEAYPYIVERKIPEGDWRWTDDTQMAFSIVEMLETRGAIDQAELARAFARRMEPTRGYGVGAHAILTEILEGKPWRRASRGAFEGRGSFGNGGAMRVAPLGAFFADDLDQCVHEARLSAEVTHAHEEGIAGAIAVAVAAGVVWANREKPLEAGPFLRAAIERIPAGYTQDGLLEALELPLDADIVTAAKALGNGSGVTAPDTVPLCLWIAARHPARYEDALWETVSALGDRDTNCAIVGGIVGVVDPPPEAWRRRREPLPLR